ncbi:hypothetical protein B7P43_G10878 [Cryptotermes secundus]|uniref:Uncharacterized protein n=1 Tax=Cryptotermes secundus TaxID=105785 RepID=A0A2J7QPJ1_9NEOP|nr:hypothetical protein B7P43_G10878 [Cryptotermes secundus]
MQMLPKGKREKRGILNLGGKALKFLFGAALSEDLGPLNDKIERLRTQVGELAHDGKERLTMSREIHLRVGENAKLLAQMIRAMKSRREEEIREQIALYQQLNQTTRRIIEAEKKASYTRELEAIIMKMYTAISSITLSLDLAMTHRLTASLLPSHKLFAILRDIYVQLEQGYSFITALKPENFHVFYASAQVAVLATEEAIRLVIQLPLRHEKRTYLVYDPVALPTFEPNLGKFIRIHTGTEKLAVSSDRRSYMLLPADYIKNCQEGVITICQGVVPTIERTDETCLSSLYFGTTHGYSLCSREIVSNDFRPIFRKLS